MTWHKIGSSPTGFTLVTCVCSLITALTIGCTDSPKQTSKPTVLEAATTSGSDNKSDDGPATWSPPLLGLMGRLVVAAPRISTSEQFDLSLELRNHHYGGGPWLAVQSGNPFLFEVSVADAEGKSVKPTMQRADVIHSPQWQVIRPFPAERLTIPISIRSIDGARGSHLDTVTNIWKLPPGKYKIAATYTSPKEASYEGDATAWNGKLELAPVEVEIGAPQTPSGSSP